MNTRQAYPVGEFGTRQFVFDLQQQPPDIAKQVIDQSRRKILERTDLALNELKEIEKELKIPKPTLLEIEALIESVWVNKKLQWTHKKTGNYYRVAGVAYAKEIRQIWIIYSPLACPTRFVVHVDEFLREFE